MIPPPPCHDIVAVSHCLISHDDDDVSDRQIRVRIRRNRPRRGNRRRLLRLLAASRLLLLLLLLFPEKERRRAHVDEFGSEDGGARILRLFQRNEVCFAPLISSRKMRRMVKPANGSIVLQCFAQAQATYRKCHSSKAMQLHIYRIVRGEFSDI